MTRAPFGVEAHEPGVAPTRRGVPVVDHRARLIDHPPATQAEAPAEVRVLVVHEVVLVEDADVGQGLAAQERGSAAKGEDLLPLVELAGIGLPTPSVATAAIAEQQRPGVLNHSGGLREQQLRSHRPGPRVGAGNLDQSLEPARAHARVVVEQDHQLAPRLADAEVVARSEPKVPTRFDHAHALMSLPDVLRGPITGAVVHQKHLMPTVHLLVERSAQAGVQEAQAVPVQDNDRNARVRPYETSVSIGL